MIDTSLLAKSIGIGVAVAAPVGPMSLLCMRTTLTRGWRHGFAIGVGIAIGDAIYGTVAALGLAGLSSFMLAHQKPLHMAAGLFLIYLGLKTFASGMTPSEEERLSAARGWWRSFTTSILLTLTNPPTIVMFAAVFTALAPTGGLDPAGALVTVAGVFLGSLLWWCAVVVLISALRNVVGQTARAWIDRVSGVVLAGLGLVELRRAAAS
jgi:threonine/homoserine/homoserine lactone efflux protein